MAKNKNPKPAVVKEEPKAPSDTVEQAAPAAKTPYQEHMADWESKKDAAEKSKLESSKVNSDFAKHPKFDKFNSKGSN